jgi:hypothetical protein
MPHLDDGQIAEWIDAADRPHGQTAHGAVADHLRQCTVCRERVEEARRIAERARAILGAAAPTVTDVPPFEVVLARAGRTAVRRGVNPTWRWLAWAATVAIAGGLGWYVRGAELRRSVGEAQAPTAVAQIDSAAPLAATPPEQTGGGAVGGVAPAPAADRRAAVVPAPARQEEKVARADRPTAEAKVAAQEADAVQRDTIARGAIAGVAAAPPAAAAPSVARNAAEPVADELPAGWSVVSREVAERALGGPVATVPGLPVARYELLVPESAVRVLQVMPSGAQLELIETAAPKGEPSASYAGREREQGRGAFRTVAAAQDSVTLNGVRVTLRAAVTPDSLKVLLGKIRR